MIPTRELSGKQFKIDPSVKTLWMPFMTGAKQGQEVALTGLLSQDNSGKLALKGGTLPTATVLGHSRGEKVIVFHKKRRKRYRKTNGHTPKFTELSLNW